MIDGEARLSCLCLAGQVSVLILSLLRDYSRAHLPIQTCFAEHGGSQCGFCTLDF